MIWWLIIGALVVGLPSTWGGFEKAAEGDGSERVVAVIVTLLSIGLLVAPAILLAVQEVVS